MKFQIRYTAARIRGGIAGEYSLVEGRHEFRKAVEFVDAQEAEDVVRTLVQEIRNGEGGWIGLMLDAHFDMPHVEEVWVVAVQELAGSRRAVAK